MLEVCLLNLLVSLLKDFAGWLCFHVLCRFPMVPCPLPSQVSWACQEPYLPWHWHCRCRRGPERNMMTWSSWSIWVMIFNVFGMCLSCLFFLVRTFLFFTVSWCFLYVFVLVFPTLVVSFWLNLPSKDHQIADRSWSECQKRQPQPAYTRGSVIGMKQWGRKWRQQWGLDDSTQIHV